MAHQGQSERDKPIRVICLLHSYHACVVARELHALTCLPLFPPPVGFTEAIPVALGLCFTNIAGGLAAGASGRKHASPNMHHHHQFRSFRFRICSSDSSSSSGCTCSRIKTLRRWAQLLTRSLTSAVLSFGKNSSS